MKKQILTAILASFLVGIFGQIILFIYFFGRNSFVSPESNSYYLKQGLGIAVLVNSFFLLASLPSFFLRSTSKPLLKFTVWFGLRSLVLGYIICAMIDWYSFDRENILIIPFANSLAWWFYWLKVKKI